MGRHGSAARTRVGTELPTPVTRLIHEELSTIDSRAPADRNLWHAARHMRQPGRTAATDPRQAGLTVAGMVHVRRTKAVVIA